MEHPTLKDVYDLATKIALRQLLFGLNDPKEARLGAHLKVLGGLLQTELQLTPERLISIRNPKMVPLPKKSAEQFEALKNLH